MKTLKKTLCLVLAVVMVVGVLIIPANAAETTASDKVDAKYEEAVAVIKGVGIMTGDEDGFRPKDTLTRSEAAKLIVYLFEGPTAAAAYDEPVVTGFSDVDALDGFWASGYIGYCVDKGIIGGNGDGTFGYDDPLTAAAFAKMLLCGLGYDAETEGFTGVGFESKVATAARNAKAQLTADLAGLKIDNVTPITREQAATMAFNGLTKAKTVEYEGGFNFSSGDTSITTGGTKTYSDDPFYKVSAIADYANLTPVEKAANTTLGRPNGSQWTLNGTPIYTEKLAATKTYHKASEAAQFAKDFKAVADSSTVATTGAYINGKADSSKNTVDAVKGLIKDGYTVEVYADAAGKITDVVVFQPQLAKVTVGTDKVTLGYDKDGHDALTDTLDVTAKTEDANKAWYDTLSKCATGYVAVVMKDSGESNNTEIIDVQDVTIVSGKLTKVAGDTYTINDKDYTTAEGHITITSQTPSATTDVYVVVDQYGFLLGFIDNPDGGDTAPAKYIFVVDSWNGTAGAYGVADKYVQGVLTDGTIVSKKLATGSSVSSPDAGTVYEYEEVGDDVKLKTAASGGATANGALKLATAETVNADAKRLVTNTAGNFFASDVVFIFVSEETKSDLEVKVMTGVQAVSITTAKADYAIIDGTDHVITVVFVWGDEPKTEVDGTGKIFVKSGTSTGKTLDKTGALVETYKVFIDGVETEIMSGTAPEANSWYTYKVDSETGVYTLTKIDAGDYATKKVTGELTIDGSTKKLERAGSAYYFTCNTPELKAVVATDAVVVDLTNNTTKITSIADLYAAATNEKKNELKVYVAYGDDVVAVIYVTTSTVNP